MGQNDPHLRSSAAVTGYHIQATDGDIGHVEDFLLDDRSWTIRFMVVDTTNWWAGEKVLIAPAWIERVDWDHVDNILQSKAPPALSQIVSALFGENPRPLSTSPSPRSPSLPSPVPSVRMSRST